MRSLHDVVYPGVYGPGGIELTTVQRARAAWLWVAAQRNRSPPQHWTDPKQRDRDIDRYTALIDLGWTITRVSSELLRYRRATLIARVEAAMYAAGWTGPCASGNSAAPYRRVAS